MPEGFSDLLLAARTALKEGRPDDALATAQRAYEIRPSDPQVRFLIGTIVGRLGRFKEAVQWHEADLAIAPESFETLSSLCMLTRQTCELQKSLGYGERAVRLKPDFSQAHSNLGLTQLAMSRLLDSAASFEQAIRLDPKISNNYEQLAKILMAQGREDDALKAYEQVRRLAPESATALAGIAQILFNRNRTAAAVNLAKKALALDPNLTTARMIVAGGLISEGKQSEAQEEVEALIASNSESANAVALEGTRLQSVGRLQEANDAFRRSIGLQAVQGFSYNALVRASKITEEQAPLVRQMEDLLANPAMMPRGKAFLHYGLGKAYEDLGDYKRSMGHYEIANEISYGLKFGSLPFDPVKLSQFANWVLATFTEELLATQAVRGNPSDCPIFVVGMMRSGTTLVEQILSSHPQIEAAGERMFWSENAHEAIQPGERHLDSAALRRLSETYLKELKSLFPEARHITDKMPGNYRILGVVAAAFPNAKVIDVKRNAIDTCLSIYTTPNRASNDFANNKGNIAFAYQQYLRLMAHWRGVLDPSRLMTVHYEQLVEDPEPVTRGLIDFCGLPWDDRCLRPEENQRSVVTPSSVQVRQPVYRSSVERWRKFEPWLGPFAGLKEG